MSGLGIIKNKIIDKNEPIRCKGCLRLYADQKSYDDHVLFCEELNKIKDKRNN